MKIKNDYFFDKIDSEIKAYLLGFYIGDGTINLPTKKKIRYEFRVGVSENDSSILHLFQEYISPESEIKTSSNFGKISTIRGRSFKSRDCKYIQISSKKLCLRLDSMGYGQSKTHKDLLLPNIDNNLIKHVLRGYFDADGVCITGAYNRNDRNSDTKQIKSTFCITAKRRCLLNDIQIYLFNEIGIDIKIYYEASRDVYNLKTSCRQHLIKLYNYLYDDANFYLERKKKSFSLVMLTPREFRELKSSEPRNA